MISILLSIFSPIKRILCAVWAWCSANPTRLAIIALIALCGYLALSNASLRGDVRHRDKVIANLEQASKDATAAQMALNKQVTDKQTDIARKTDNATSDIIDRGRAYAVRMPAKDYCRKTDTPAESGAAPSNNAASDTAVILERTDYDILVANTARLVKVKAWGDELIHAGLAVPVE
jgi:hypothetical protein